uniref:Uncharacterized protein n=1 Tax=Loa loa TaxID=7209 RepID=A0A1I7W4T3_LOALO
MDTFPKWEGMTKTDVDEDYIKTLEIKLRNLRKDEAQLNSKDILNDLKSYREDKLFRLLTKPDHCFEDNFIDQPVVVSYLRRKLAPKTVAVHKGELISLLEADQVALKNLEVNEEVTSTKTSTRNATEESKTVTYQEECRLKK